MAAPDITLVDSTEIERIERWRAEELERAGYELRAADRLAARHDVDLHTAIELQQAFTSPPLRIGLHSGFVMADASEFFGRNVVLAQRIALAANVALGIRFHLST